MAETVDGETGGSGSNDRRAPGRQAVFKSAKLIYNECVTDCLVLNVSPLGARVQTSVPAPIPEQVRLRFSDGATFLADRRWVGGLDIGFAFDGTASLQDAEAELALKVRAAVQATSIEEPIRLLKSVRFFGDVALQAVAEKAEAGLRDLEKHLTDRMRAPKPSL